MSYILDALRRADAERERERGAVPGLHAQQFTLASEDDGGGKASRKLLYVSIGLGVALALALAWKLLGSSPPVMAAAPAPMPATATAPVPMPMPLQAPLSAPVTIPASVPMATPASTQAPSLPARSARAVASAPLLRPAPMAVTPARAAAQSDHIYTQAELPEDIRRGMPRLTVGGASYSSDAASRMVIINGQVLHEGDRVGNGLVLQQIKLKAAVLATRGYRFEITY